MACPQRECRRHEWLETYYGYRCRVCDLFYPFGSEPWFDTDQEDQEEMENDED